MQQIIKFFGVYSLSQLICAFKLSQLHSRELAAPQLRHPQHRGTPHNGHSRNHAVARPGPGRSQAVLKKKKARFEQLVDFYVVKAFKKHKILMTATTDAFQNKSMAVNIFDDDDQKIALTHGKCGTNLMYHLVGCLSRTLGLTMEQHSYPWKHVYCSATPIHFYSDFCKAEADAMKRQCPNARGVHMLRDPAEIVVSGYLYHLWSRDTYGLPTGPERLKGKPMDEGILIEAEAQMRTFQEMLDTLEVTRGNPKILHLSVNDFEASFDYISRIVFTNWLGSKDSRVNLLVTQAATADVSRWTDKSHDNNHVANEDKAFEATKVLAKLIQNGSHPTIVKLLEFRRKLHYIVAA